MTIKSRLSAIDPLTTFAKRNPSFYQRYVDQDDEFGYSLQTFARWEPVFRFLYDDHFHVHLKGIENIPSEGPAIIAGNHSGVLPLDGAMLAMALCNHHPAPRRVRYLATDWFFSMPVIAEWCRGTGQVRATLENAGKLIERDELVGIYPEGFRGVGKPYRERYRVMNFHPGFVQLAIATQTPLIPIATLGGDEIYPEFLNAKRLAQFLEMPFFPITPTFPWLPFPLFLWPLPVHWMIHVHEPVHLPYEPEQAKDRSLVLRVAREIQYDIQRDLNRMLRERKSLFTSEE